MLRKLLRSPEFWGVLAAILIVAPNIPFYDLLATDNLQAAIASGSINYPGMSAWNLYHFADGIPEQNARLASHASWPWFTSPHWKFSFCRHLPSLLIYAHVKVFGLHLASYPIHGLLWMIVLILLIAKFTRIVFRTSETLLPLLAVLAFAFSPGNMPIIFYSAARYMYMVAVFCMGGLLAHIQWREKDWKPGRWISILLFLLSLLSGEATVAAFAFLFCYEWLYSSDTFRDRIKAVMPITILVVVYLGLYKLIGYGTGGQDAYVNPFGDPHRFLSELPVRMLTIFGESTFHLQSVLRRFTRPSPVAAGAIVISAFFLLLLPAWRSADASMRRRLNWLCAGSLVSVIPLCSGPLAPRLAIFPSLGVCLLISYILRYWIFRTRQWKNFQPALTILGLIACCGLFYAHFIAPSLRWFANAAEGPETAALMKQSHEQAILNDTDPNGQVFFLNYSEWIDPMDEYYYRKLHRIPVSPVWRQLSFCSCPHNYRRTADNKLELSVKKGTITEYSGNSGAFRSQSEPFHSGDVVHLQEVNITVMETDGANPTRVEFAFPVSLDDKRLRLFRFNENGLVNAVQLPRIGETLEIQ